MASVKTLNEPSIPLYVGNPETTKEEIPLIMSEKWPNRPKLSKVKICSDA